MTDTSTSPEVVTDTGRKAMSAFHLPDPKWFIIGAIAVLVVVGQLIPSVRSLILNTLVPILQRAVHGIAEVLRRPGTVVALLGPALHVLGSHPARLGLLHVAAAP